MAGVRAEFVFERPAKCPVAASSAGADDSLRDISWASESDGTVTEQFRSASEPSETDAEAVFDYGTQQVYEFERDYDEPCICEYIEQALGPVADAHAVDGNLHVTLHASDVDGLRDLLGDLTDQFETVRVEYLVQSRGSVAESRLVPVNLRRLTDRQQEVLDTAHEMGYFEYPRDSNASEVAEQLDIEPSTFTEHLNAAQSKLLDELLARG